MIQQIESGEQRAAFRVSALLGHREIVVKPVGPQINSVPGILGGTIWSVGFCLSIIAAGAAGYAISYGLGQGATMVAAFWGVFIWKEFEDSPEGTNRLIAAMFALFILGLGLIIYSRIA